MSRKLQDWSWQIPNDGNVGQKRVYNAQKSDIFQHDQNFREHNAQWAEKLLFFSNRFEYPLEVKKVNVVYPQLPYYTTSISAPSWIVRPPSNVIMRFQWESRYLNSTTRRRSNRGSTVIPWVLFSKIQLCSLNRVKR